MEFHDRPTSGNLSTSRVVSSFGGKHVYDGVFSGSSSVKAKTAGMDDYGEIFRGSGGSIPVLDVSELKDRNFSPVDAVPTSKIDYSKIFGGFGDDDIGVPYEELVAKPTKPRKNSTREIRVPARSESVGWEPVPSSEVTSEPVDGVKQVNVLYNKTNPGCKNGGANGTTHIAQLHAVPGYTRLIDESSPSSMTQSAKPVRSVLHEAHLNGVVDPGISPGKLPKKAVSGPLPSGDFKSMSRSDTGVRRKSSRSGSISGNMSFDGFEIGLDMNSTSPPNLGNGNAGFFNKPMDMKAGVPINDVSEGADGSYSPPSFYKAIDANSAAAASAAAVIKAIEEAQAKIKFARDLMERKKEGLQNGVKLSFYNGLRSQKKEVKSAASANRSEQEKAQKISVKEDAPKNIFTGLTEHNAVKASQSIPHPSYKKYSIDANNIKEVCRTKSTSAQAGDRLKEPENEKATGTLIGNVGPVEDRAMNLETEQEDKAPALAFKSAENVKEMTPFVSENGYREKVASEKSLKKAKEFSKEPPALEEAPQHEKVERGLNLVGRTFEIDMCTENITSAQHEEADNKPKASCELGNCGSTLKLLQELGEIANVQAQELKEKNDMMEQKESEDWVDINRKQREVRSQEEMDGGSHEAQAGEELERKLDEIHGQEGNEKGHKEDWVECDEELEEDCHQEKNENKEGDFIGEVTQDKSGDEVRLDDPQDKEQTEMTYREGEEKGNENLEEAKKDGNTLKKDYPVNEISKKQADTFKLGDTETTQLEIEQMKEDRKNTETTQQYLINQKNNCEAADDKYKQNENKNLAASDEACEKEKIEGVEVSPEGHAQNGRIMEVNEGFPVTEYTEKASKPAEDANVLEEEENPETAGLSQDYIELGTSKKQAVGITKTPLMDKKDAFSGETDCNFENEQIIYDVTEHKKFGGQENHTEEVPSGLDDIDEDINESEIVSTGKETVINFASYEERWSDSGTRRRWDLKNCVRDVVCKWEENDDDMKQSEANTDHEDEDYFESSSEERWVGTNGFYVETNQACVFDGEGKAMEFPKEEETSQSMDKNDEHHGTLEEREAEDTSKREADVENELHRRREEAKEREMEKEKERIAVERAIREARERAFAEARARAEKAAVERASAEAHQRLRAETRERLDKASADANKATEKAQEAKLRAETRERSEKASAEANKATEKVQEAKLRAERAAVERVTAEARKRALEKALFEKAASKARNKSEKFAAEKSTGTPKDGGISSSDQHYKGPGPSSSSRHPSSSNNAERYNGASGESMQRSKASSEKDQRMAERAAKALAEKNMRDLLAQKEQADRNRLAETLDAEVKRWSSGKERNLRALLSTLQYILGADSGWQPIPLTELIPATAVKKAYRKATLFVHPDKLQQRGASIQQKYTCEKVFDLLKEAWNRYSAEER